MLQHVINEASTNIIYGKLSIYLPKMNDEKELYGC
jgi:hypothetical protein